MCADVADRELPPFNPVILRWARGAAGVSTIAAAKRAAVKEARILDWESDQPQSLPTVRQARALASLYGRSFLEFFRKEIPPIAKPVEIPDFRLFKGVDTEAVKSELNDVQLWAETQRVNALDLYAELGEEPPNVPESIFSRVEDDAETAAESVRAAIKFPIESQIGRNSRQRSQIPTEIRRAIERIGVLTFRRTDIDHLGVRGFCFAAFPLPVIVFGKEAPTAQGFTLAHELAHIALKQSAISGPVPRTGGNPNIRRIEVWCDRFAGAFLMPSPAIASFLPQPSEPQEMIPEEILRLVSQHFGVSGHAMLVRLVQLGYVNEDYYWKVMKPKYDEIESKYRAFGRSPYYGTMYRNRQGDLYTSLVLDAWSMGRITGHNAAEFMGIKKIQHMLDIREKYRGG
jgi:Zn-dependent peptidase ImmA (M78 family)